MKRSATLIQIAIVSLLIVYGTVSLFLGHFEGALITFPFLIFYYVFIVARQKRRGGELDDGPQDDGPQDDGEQDDGEQ